MNVDNTLDKYGPYIDLTGRLLIAAIYLLSGFEQIHDFAGTQGWMESKGVPGALLYLVIALEISGSLAIIVGWQTKMVAFLLAAYTLLAALLFHMNWSDEQQYFSFMKNLGMAGGFLFLAVNGAGRFSMDARK